MGSKTTPSDRPRLARDGHHRPLPSGASVLTMPPDGKREMAMGARWYRRLDSADVHG